MDDLIGSGLETIVLDDISLNQPVANLIALAAIPTADLEIGCNVWVVSTHRYYEWGGSSWSPSTVPYDLNILSTQGIVGSDLMYRQNGTTLYKNTIDQLKTYVNPNVIIYYDAAVDGVGTAPNSYATWSAAIAAGKKSIKTTASFLEVTTVTPPANCYIYIGPGVTANLSTHPIDLTNAVNFTIQGFNEISSTIEYSPSTDQDLLINAASSGLTIIINDVYLSLTAIPEGSSVSIMDPATQAVVQTTNLTISIGSGYTQIAYNREFSYFNKLTIIGNGSDSYIEIWGDQACVCKDLSFLGSFGGIPPVGQFAVSFSNNCTLDGVRVILDEAPASDSGLQISLLNGGQVYNGYSNFDTGLHITTGDAGNFVIYNFNALDSIFFNDIATGSVANCSALQYYEFEGCTVRKTGNNAIIGNDYTASSTGVDFFTGYVDGVGSSPNSYATVGDAVAASVGRIHVTANTTETANVLFLVPTLIYIDFGFSIGMGIYQFDLTNIDKLAIEAPVYIAGSITYAQTTDDMPLFINASAVNVNFNNMFFDLSECDMTVAQFNESGNDSTSTWTNVDVRFPLGASDIYVDNVVSTGFLRVGTNPPEVGANSAAIVAIYCNNTTLTNLVTNDSGDEARVISDGPLNVISAISAVGILKFIINSSDFYISNAIMNTLTISGAYDGALVGCSASTYTPGGGTVARVGNNNVIGNDYDVPNGLNPFDAYVDGIGALPNSYATLGAAAAASIANIHVMADTTETGDVTFLVNSTVYVDSQTTIGMGAYQIDTDALQRLSFSAPFRSSGSLIVYSQPDLAKPLFKNSTATYIVFENFAADLSGSAAATVDMNESGSTGGIEFHESSVILASGVITNIFCAGYSLNSGVVTATDAVANIHIGPGYFVGLQANTGSSCTINAMLTTGLLSYSTINTSTTFNVTIDGSGYVLDNLDPIDTLTISGDYAGSITNCSATTFGSAVSSAALIRIGNNNVIGNDYLTEELPYWGQYSAIVGPGQMFTTVADALGGGAADIMVVGNTAEPSNWLITQDTNILILSATVDMAQFKIDRSAAIAATVNVVGCGASSIWAWEPNGSSSSVTYMCINQNSSSVTSIKNLNMPISLYDPAGTAVLDFADTGTVQFDGVEMTCPEVNFILSLNTKDGYFINSNCTGPSALANFALAGGGSTLNARAIDNVKFYGHFYLLSIGNGTTGHTFSNINFNLTMDTNVTFDAPDNILKNITSNHTYDIRCLSDECVITIANCPNIGTLSGTYRDTTFTSTIIASSAVTNTCTIYAGCAAPYRSANNALIGNDYTLLPTSIGFYDGYVDGTGTAINSYVNVRAAVSAGCKTINVTQASIETGDIVFIADTYIYIQPTTTIVMGNHSFDLDGGNAYICSQSPSVGSIVSSKSSGGEIFKNLDSANATLTLRNLTVSMGSVTDGDFNKSGDLAGIILENVVFSVKTTLGVFIDGSQSIGCSMQDCSIAGDSAGGNTAVPTITLKNNVIAKGITFFGGYADDSTALVLENMQISDVNFQLGSAPASGDGLRITTVNSQITNVNSSYNTGYNLQFLSSGNILTSAENCDILNNGGAYDNTIIGSSANSYIPPTAGHADIKVGNNLVIGNDYIGAATTDTLTNKSISGATNTLSAIPGASINSGSVTYTQIQNVSATDKVLGRVTAGAGVIEEISCTSAGRSMIGAANSAAQRSLLGLDTVNVGGYTALIQTVANVTYTVVAYAGCAGTILGVGELARALTTAGTFAVAINGTNVTGLASVPPSTSGSYTTASALNTFVRGDKIAVIYSGTTLVVDHSLLIDFTQAV